MLADVDRENFDKVTSRIFTTLLVLGIAAVVLVALVSGLRTSLAG